MYSPPPSPFLPSLSSLPPSLPPTSYTQMHPYHSSLQVLGAMDTVTMAATSMVIATVPMGTASMTEELVEDGPPTTFEAGLSPTTREAKCTL